MLSTIVHEMRLDFMARSHSGKKNSLLVSVIIVFSMLVTLCACGTSPAEEESALVSEIDTNKVYKVGIVTYNDDTSAAEVVRYLQRQLSKKNNKGNQAYDYKKYTKNAHGDSNELKTIGEELVESEVDCIVAVGTEAAQSMRACVRGTEIPAVFTSVPDPVEAGLVKSLETPGGNITGFSEQTDTETILKLMLEADPDTELVGLLYDNKSGASQTAISDAKRFLDSKGIQYLEKTASNEAEVYSAAKYLVDEGVDAVFTPNDASVLASEYSIYRMFIDSGIPHYCGGREFAAAGAFLGYGTDNATLGLNAADLVEEILTGKADPAETAVQVFDQGEATVNTETAEEIGVNVESVMKLFKSVCGSVDQTKTSADSVANKPPETEEDLEESY